jgi:membrane associated rhomboid family serine protease
MLFLGAEKGHSYGRFPWVSVGLVVINVIVFWAQVSIGDPFTYGFSLVPEEITTFQDLTGPKARTVWVYESSRVKGRPGQHVAKEVVIQHYPGPVPIHLTLLTSMFMHGSFLHLFLNMWCLLIFGRNVECALGHGLFLAFYLVCGLLAGLAHVASDVHSILPYLGASGAIAGVMGAYVAIYPLSTIKIWFIVVFELPALVVLAGWVILQYLFAMIVDTQTGGVAYWAHLGGFFAGIFFLCLIVFILRSRADADDAAKKESDRRSGQFAAANPKEPTDADAEPDPYADFITIKTIRRMRENKNSQRPPDEAQ